MLTRMNAGESCRGAEGIGVWGGRHSGNGKCASPNGVKSQDGEGSIRRARSAFERNTNTARFEGFRPCKGNTPPAGLRRERKKWRFLSEDGAISVACCTEHSGGRYLAVDADGTVYSGG